MTKKARIPPGGMGNGLERAYSEKNFIICYYNISKIIWILLVLIQYETNILQSSQNLKKLSKGRPLGGFGWSQSHFEQQLLLFLLFLLKYREHVRMKYSQKHFESTFGLAYFKPNKTKLKLAETVKKEPRKASFLWDLDFLFGNPMKYALITGFNLFKTEK